MKYVLYANTPTNAIIEPFSHNKDGWSVGLNGKTKPFYSTATAIFNFNNNKSALTSTKQNKTRHDRKRQDGTRKEKTREEKTRHATTRHDTKRKDKTRKTRQDMTSQNK